MLQEMAWGVEATQGMKSVTCMKVCRVQRYLITSEWRDVINTEVRYWSYNNMNRDEMCRENIQSKIENVLHK